MAKWNELDGWDLAGGAAEKIAPYLKAAANAIEELVVVAGTAVNEQRVLTVNTHQMALAWDKVTTALKHELTIWKSHNGAK